MDYVGIWNEQMYNATWIKIFRTALNNGTRYLFPSLLLLIFMSAGLANVQIIAADDCCGPEGPWGIATNVFLLLFV